MIQLMNTLREHPAKRTPSNLIRIAEWILTRRTTLDRYRLPQWLVIAAALLLSTGALAGAGKDDDAPASGFEILKFVLSVLGYIGGLTAFVIGLKQYRRADYWKRSEFLAKEMKEFFSDPAVMNALTMIDWGLREVPLFTSDGNPTRTNRVRVDRILQCNALRPHTMLSSDGASDEVSSADFSGPDNSTSGGAHFTRAEAAIRDCYDKFLDGFDRYGNYLTGELVSVQDLEPYLKYWVMSIADTDCNGEDALWSVCLLAYVDFYAFLGVRTLFRGFGIDISMEGALISTFVAKSSDQARAKNLVAHVIGKKNTG